MKKLFVILVLCMFISCGDKNTYSESDINRYAASEVPEVSMGVRGMRILLDSLDSNLITSQFFDEDYYPDRQELRKESTKLSHDFLDNSSVEVKSAPTIMGSYNIYDYALVFNGQSNGDFKFDDPTGTYNKVETYLWHQRYPDKINDLGIPNLKEYAYYNTLIECHNVFMSKQVTGDRISYTLYCAGLNWLLKYYIDRENGKFVVSDFYKYRLQ